jgi:oxygen-independent coproporphyrinogen-3 oxidase
MENSTIIQKYNVPGPRYTSYPTVPAWNITQWDAEAWLSLIQQAQTNEEKKQLALYIHLPFCESLCTFCGCHKHITKNHSIETGYIDSVLQEWKIISAVLDSSSTIDEIHLGGGTPTFFSPQELVRLITGIRKLINFSDSIEMSFEAHPNSTTIEHLTELAKLGFKRISYGIQDYDPVVQEAIHRIQSKEQIELCHKQAKAVGYDSVSHDLVFGLPKQTMAGFSATVEQTLVLKPDRIALYSYAHVPWVKGTGQRGYDESDLPSPTLKRELYEFAKVKFVEAGYVEIGMDHFALPSDSLAIALKNRTLHRNFMGYTTTQTSLLLGLGMSAISDCKLGFAQNVKSTKEYQLSLQSGKLPITKGHQLSELDLEIRQHILNLMCLFETQLPEDSLLNLATIQTKLSEMISDKLVEIIGNTVKITEAGIPFVRNCCMAFDAYLTEQSGERKFSMTV